MNRSDILVMRMTQFGESDLILSGLTPLFGRLDFILKGARKTGPKKFPAAGLFRVISGEFRDPAEKNGLLSLRGPSLVRDFDSIAFHTAGYLAACDYMRTLLTLCRPMAECPDTYTSVLVLLQRLSEGAAPEPVVTAARMVQLREAGLLPEPDSDRAALQNHLLESGMGTRDLPDLNPAYWEKISRWAEKLQNSLSLH